MGAFLHSEKTQPRTLILRTELLFIYLRECDGSTAYSCGKLLSSSKCPELSDRLVYGHCTGPDSINSLP